MKANEREASQYAPWYDLPRTVLVSIEHPFIIQNVDKAVNMLGGFPKLKSLVEDDNQGASTNLYLWPHDPMCKPVTSKNVITNDVVLKITVPKRTGLKRRRGSSGPYHEQGKDMGGLAPSIEPQSAVPISKDTRYMLRSLRDNVKNYEIHAIGSIYQTHRFRSMPDFVYSTANSPFMTKMRETILPFQYEKMKSFKLDMSKGPRIKADLIPPPRWSHITVPFNYQYLQNPAAKQTLDSHGNITIKNFQIAPPAQNQAVAYDVLEVPSGPAQDLPPITSLEPAMQRLIQSARILLEARPIWTRRAIRSHLSEADRKIVGNNAAKYVYQYVGYLWASGPWRDALVKFGVDPRKDPSYRIYQTMMFMVDLGRLQQKEHRALSDPPSSTKNPPKENHMFDGKSVVVDGKVWQVCDITDPLLVSILSTTNLRKECHIFGDGWYLNGTWSKAKIIMKAKIASLLAGVPPNDTEYMRVVKKFPENVNDTTRHLTYFDKGNASTNEIRLATYVRAASRKSELDEKTMGSHPTGKKRARGVDEEGGETGTEDVDTDAFEDKDVNENGNPFELGDVHEDE